MTAETATVAKRRGRPPLVNWLRANALQVGITIVAIIIWAIFAIGSPETFFRRNIYQAFMSTTPFFGIMALPLTLVVITGEIDLSFPSIMTISMWVFAAVLVATRNLAIALAAMLFAELPGVREWIGGVLIIGVTVWTTLRRPSRA